MIVLILSFTTDIRVGFDAKKACVWGFLTRSYPNQPAKVLNTQKIKISPVAS